MARSGRKPVYCATKSCTIKFVAMDCVNARQCLCRRLRNATMTDPVISQLTGAQGPCQPKPLARNWVYCRVSTCPLCLQVHIEAHDMPSGLADDHDRPRGPPRNLSGRWANCPGQVLLVETPADVRPPSRCADRPRLAICHQPRSARMTPAEIVRALNRPSSLKINRART